MSKVGQFVFAVALVCSTACSSLDSKGAQTAFDIARDALNVAASLHSGEPDVVRRLSIASSALDAVRNARDSRALEAAAPCAADALRAVAPDLKSDALAKAVSVAVSALEKVGGSCNVDGRDDDAGVPN